MRQLCNQGEEVRALILPGDPWADLLPSQAEQVRGDLLRDEDLARFFQVEEGKDITVIHCASIITMSMSPLEQVYRVNVLGTQKLVQKCLEHKVSHYIHVASVHAITEAPKGQVMTEPTAMNPEQLVGYYAKTKAEAVDLVMKARKERGLPASIVYPSGLCGPGDVGKGSLTQLFLDYMAGKIKILVRGGYNFADVRDVASAMVCLARQPDRMNDYILAGEYISMVDIISEIQQISGGKPVKTLVPYFLAKALVPLLSLIYKIRGVQPVVSHYALYTLTSNSLFSSEKAKEKLGYLSRPIRETLQDTSDFLNANKHLF